MQIEKLKPLTNEFLEQIGFAWHTDEDQTPYIADEAIIISEDESEAFYEAGNELYEMFCEAGEYVVKNDLFHELNIPFNLTSMIKSSWENDENWHLYGRFDFAGGLDGEPIKLLEFNADTPTSLFETSIIQWALLKANDLDESKQFNFIYEALKDNFKRLITLSDDVSEFNQKYQGYKMLFSSIKGNIEEEMTTKLLQKIAIEAGLQTEFAFFDEVAFSDDGVFLNNNQYELFFKLIPWEDIAFEDDLALILSEISKNQNAIFYNPAYTLMFQSKGMLKILWDLFPNHPLLLESSFEPLKNKPFVEKKCFGREGANIKIFDTNANLIESNGGEYENFKSIFQQYANLNTHNGKFYQAGVFFAYESCGLGFRKSDSKIINNTSKFVSHLVR